MVKVLPAPLILRVPPVAKVTVTGDISAVPTAQVPAVIVMANDMVHVSPGVVKLVGDTVPSDQLPNVVTGPAVTVLHAVAWLSRQIQQSIRARMYVLI